VAKFYGTMDGRGKQVTVTGNADSGACAHVRGWDVGGMVDIAEFGGKTVVRLYATGGSGDPGKRHLIAEFSSIEEVNQQQEKTK